MARGITTRTLASGALVAVGALVASGCGPFGAELGSVTFRTTIPASAVPGESIPVSWDGSAWLTNSTRPFGCWSVTETFISFVDSSGAPVGSRSDRRAAWDNPGCQGLDPRRWTLSTVVTGSRARVTVPATASGRTQWITFMQSNPIYEWFPDSYYLARLERGVLTVAGKAPGAAGPTARLLQAQMPVAPEGQAMRNTFPGLVDARQSTDPGGSALTYSWDLNGDGAFGDDPLAAYRDSGGAYPVAADLPAGMAWIQRGGTYVGGAYPKVSVRVTNASGASSDATADIRVVEPGSGLLAFGAARGGTAYSASPAAPGGAVDLFVFSPVNDANGGYATYACFDANGDGVYGDAVTNHAGVPYAGGWVEIASQLVGSRSGTPVRLTAPSSVGQHVVRAIIWDPANLPSVTTTKCQTPFLPAPDTHRSAGVRSQLAALVTVGSGRSIEMSRSDQRGPRGAYSARSTSRFTPRTALAAGTYRNGTVQGNVVRGTYSLSAPARARGVKRPPALGALLRGNYVMRARSWSVLPTGSGTTVRYVGQSTVLLQGRDGVRACLSVSADESGVATTLTGGTGAAAKLSLTSREQQVPFELLPASALAKLGKGGKRGPVLLSTRPARGAGEMQASTRSRARGLPGACRGLVRYLGRGR